MCLLFGNIERLIEFSSFLGWMFYGTSMVALLVMRYTKRDVKRAFKVCILLYYSNERNTYKYGGMVFISGNCIGLYID